MQKNQLQELAQRSCFSLPSYTSLRDGPEHAPRFKAIVNFNGENFESPQFFSNLRQAEHAAAKVALVSLSSRGPSHSLTARILDETGVYKNLLQEIAQRVGSPLPRYATYKSGLGHLPVFTGVVELAGITFKGEPAKNKKQAEKNAALAAWLSLKQLAQQDTSSSSEHENEEQEQIRIARALKNYHVKQKPEMSNSCSFQRKYSGPTPHPSSPQRPTSKILPFFCQNNASRDMPSSIINCTHTTLSHLRPPSRLPPPEIRTTHTPRFPVGRIPYVPINHCRSSYVGTAPPVTVRSSVPVFSAPPLPPPTAQTNQVAPPVCIRQVIPVMSGSPVPRTDRPSVSASSEAAERNNTCDVDESTAIKCLEQLEI